MELRLEEATREGTDADLGDLMSSVQCPASAPAEAPAQEDSPPEATTVPSQPSAAEPEAPAQECAPPAPAVTASVPQDAPMRNWDEASLARALKARDEEVTAL